MLERLDRTPIEGYEIRSYGAAERTSCFAVTKSQIRFECDQQVFAPVYYQSCMDPSQVWIYPLYIWEYPDGQIGLESMGKAIRKIDRKEAVEVSEWIPQQKKSDCRKCVNCGRCSW